MDDYYETLGVEKNATPEQIKKAYRRRAKKAHPDHGGTTEEMTAVNVAFDCLSDAQKRLRYDATGQDNKRGAEEKLLNMLQQVMNHAIDKDLSMEQCVNVISQDIMRLGGTLRQAQDTLVRFKNRIATVRRKIKKREPNVFEKELNKRIFDQECVIKNLEEDLKLFGELRKKLRTEYEDTFEMHRDPSGLTWKVLR